MKKKVNRWFSAGAPLNWRKDEGQETRLRKVLKARGGNALAAARGLNALANVTRDKQTEQKARSDAKILFKKHNQKKR